MKTGPALFPPEGAASTRTASDGAGSAAVANLVPWPGGPASPRLATGAMAAVPEMRELASLESLAPR